MIKEKLFKASFVAQDFAQRFGIDYTFTYSPVMDATSFRWLIRFTVQRSFHMHLMDVVAAYLYDDICPCIFIKHHLKEFVIITIYVDDLNIYHKTYAPLVLIKSPEALYK